jgi:hypothetical protein
MSGRIRLSGKEVSGLAARVFASVFLPSGATGAASEAVEFLELTGAGGLTMLASEKEMLSRTGWRAPDILLETPSYVICDAGASPAPFYCAVLADWAAATAAMEGSAVIVLQGGTLGHYLGAVPYFLANRGLCGMAADLAPAGQTATSAVAPDLSWHYRRSLSPGREVIASMAGLPPRVAATADAVILAAAQPFDLPGTGAGSGFEIGSGDYRSLKTRILAEGWEIDADLWADLMSFADRSLIKTSEKSRMGAG